MLKREKEHCPSNIETMNTMFMEAEKRKLKRQMIVENKERKQRFKKDRQDTEKQELVKELKSLSTKKLKQLYDKALNSRNKNRIKPNKDADN